MIGRRNTRALVAAAAATLLVAPASQAALATYTQDFEGLTGSTALSGAGFKVYGTVFDGDTGLTPPYGNTRFPYGPFVAPNNTSGQGFSAIATGEGGVPQGAQYLNVYSDYQCCSGGFGHFDVTVPFDYVQSIVFQEQIIGAADIGTIWTLTFDAKPPAASGCDTAPASVCSAFIKTVDTAGNVTNLIAFDAKTLSNATWSTQVLAINLSDPLLNGQKLQFGFTSTSRQFNNTGVFYDNLNFALAPDTDGDGIPDVLDNCRIVPNGTLLPVGQAALSQRDTQFSPAGAPDGYGNICDPDFNNDGVVNINDFNRLKARLNITPVVDVDTDLDGNGAVNINDLNRLKSFLGKPPGPSGLHPNCPPTCP